MAWGRGILLGVALAAPLTCAAPPPKAANPTHPIAEPRAARIIANTLREAKLRPLPNRSIRLSNGRAIEIDVGVQGRRYGIAYITSADRPALQGALPEGATADALVVLRGHGVEVETRVLILLSENYMSDDSVGDEREASSVAAEQRIARDVRDFLYQAQSEKWP